MRTLSWYDGNVVVSSINEKERIYYFVAIIHRGEILRARREINGGKK